MTKVSVIIPIYNVEDYLAKCLDSVIGQTYKNIEIICVEDCSTDNSAKILKEYEKKDSRIKIVYHETNKGLSAARNTGMDNSDGEYIYFIDSDDWIDSDYVENLLNAALETKSDIVVNTNAIRHYENSSELEHLANKTYDKAENTFIDAAPAIQNIIWNTWTHLWKRSFLEKIEARFPEGELIEDIYFQIITYIQTDKIYVIRKGQYHHNYHSGSIMTSLSKRAECDQIIKIINLALDFIESHNVNKFISLATIPAHIRRSIHEDQQIKMQQLCKRIITYDKAIQQKNED